MAFTAANVAATVNPGGVYGNDAAVIDYLRGDRSGEGTAFRPRTSLMGAVINSEPVVARDEGVVYVASGEGMLHAFDTSAGNPGNELWAFVPEQGAAEHRRDGGARLRLPHQVRRLAGAGQVQRRRQAAGLGHGRGRARLLCPGREQPARPERSRPGRQA